MVITVNRRLFITTAFLSSAICKADTTEDTLSTFALTHMRMLYNFKYEDALVTCNSKRCLRDISDIRKTMKGNCRDYGVLLIDTLIQKNIVDVAGLWCRRNGEPHFVVLHKPTDFIADNFNLNAIHVDYRKDLSDFVILWEG